MKWILALLLIAGVAAAGTKRSKEQIKVKGQLETGKVMSGGVDYELQLKTDNWTSKRVPLRIAFVMVVENKKEGTTDARVQVVKVEATAKTKETFRCLAFSFKDREAKDWAVKAWGVYCYDGRGDFIAQTTSDREGNKLCYALYQATQ